MVSGDARAGGGGASLPAGVGVGKFSGGVSMPAKIVFAKSAGWAAERLAEKRGATLPPSLIVNEDGSPCPDFEGEEDSFPVRAGERISHRHCIDYEQGQESPVLVSPVGSMMMRKTEFRTGARREHLEAGNLSPLTRTHPRNKSRPQTASSRGVLSRPQTASSRESVNSSESGSAQHGSHGKEALLPQLERQSSLISTFLENDLPFTHNADYSEELHSLRRSVMNPHSKLSMHAPTTQSGDGHSHLPQGVRGFQIHKDVYVAPHKLQIAIYEARRQVKLFNDRHVSRADSATLRRMTSLGSLDHEQQAIDHIRSTPTGAALDARAVARVLKYKNVWTQNDKLSAYHKDAENTALSLLNKLNGNASGTVPPAALHERPQILEQLGKITAIKGHPLVTDLVLQCCHSKEWQERLKAVQVLPAIVFKGDPVAVGVLIGRLLDWHLEVRRAAVQTLLDSPATLVLTSVSGRDFTTPEAELAFERLQDEKAASAAASAAVTKAVALLSRRPSEAGLFTRRPSIASNAPSPLPPGSSGGRPGTGGGGSFWRAVSNVSAISSVASQASQKRKESFVASASTLIRPAISMQLVYRLENSEEDEGTQTRTQSRPFIRRLHFNEGAGEKVKIQVHDPDEATLIIELVAHVNGGGPPDESCTFHGKAASAYASDEFDRASSAASMARALLRNQQSQTFDFTNPLPPSTIVLGRAQKTVKEIANSIIKNEHWVQLTDNFGKETGSVLMKITLDPPTGIGSSATMGREMAALVAPILLDADPHIRSRGMRLYQMCLSAWWDKGRRREVSTQEQQEATSSKTRKRAEQDAAHKDLLQVRQSLLDIQTNSGHAGRRSSFASEDGISPEGSNAGEHEALDASTESGGRTGFARTPTSSARTPRFAKTPPVATPSATTPNATWIVSENSAYHLEADEDGQQKEHADEGRKVTSQVLRVEEEEDELKTVLKSPVFAGNSSLNSSLRLLPRKNAAKNELVEALLPLNGQPDPCRPEGTAACEGLELELAGMDFVVEERLQLQETAREKRTRELDEAVAEKELEVLIQALLGGLCDPDSVVVWTAVDCLKIVLRREDVRGHNEMGKRVLQVAVPLARLSEDADTRVAAIHAIYFAGKACRGWTAHNIINQVPDEQKLLDGERDASVHHQNRDRHHLSHQRVAKNAEDMEGWTLRDVLEDRLNDRDWMARRAATLAYSMLCDTGDMNALHQVIPLLSDEMHGVRSAAVQAVGTIIGKPFMMPNTQPTWLQTQILKAIVDRVAIVAEPENYTWSNPNVSDGKDLVKTTEVVDNKAKVFEIEEERRQLQAEIGARMMLLFNLGCMEFSGWQSTEHAKWKHLKDWVHNQWEQVCSQYKAALLQRKEKERQLQNKFMQDALVQLVDLDADEETRKKQTADMHMQALSRASKTAAITLQSRFRGIAGRKLSTTLKTEEFVRVQSIEIERQLEKTRIANLSKVERLQEYVGNHDVAKAKVLCPPAQEFGFHRSGISRGSSPEQDSTLPEQQRLQQGLCARAIHSRTNARGEELKEEEDFDEEACKERVASRKATLLPSISTPPSRPARGHVGWDPLGRKRSVSPPKHFLTIEEQEQEAASKFFEWEKQEDLRKKQIEELQQEKEKEARKRRIENFIAGQIRTESPQLLKNIARSPHKIKATWKCGGKKISDIVKSQYSTHSPAL